MNNNINNILEKYWNAETNLQEEAILSNYFASNDVSDNHKEYKGLFMHISQQRDMQSELNVHDVLNSIDGIDGLIKKYLEAETTLNDEKLLKSYFSGTDIKAEHLEYKPLFSFYTVASNMTTEMKFNVDSLFDIDIIDTLLSKYLNAETTLEEERVLNSYFKSEVIKDEHITYKPMFAFFDQASNMTTDIDIASVLGGSDIDYDDLLESYWNADSSLEDEKILHAYFSGDNVSEKHDAFKDLFFFYANQRSAESNLDLGQLLMKHDSHGGGAATDTTTMPQASRGKVFSMRRMASAIAAIFVLGFAAVTVMNQTSEPETQYRGKYVQLDDEADAQEAYEITKQAFALLSKKMNKSSKTVKESVKKAENASIFK